VIIEDRTVFARLLPIVATDADVCISWSEQLGKVEELRVVNLLEKSMISLSSCWIDVTMERREYPPGTQ
jgi:hypothetical protein